MLHPRWLRRIFSSLFVAGFGYWCYRQLRQDLEHGSWNALPLDGTVLLAVGGLSLVNYALRIVRWHGYLGRLGFPVPFRHDALAYLAGFAFTLSPGKVGELLKARYYAPYRVPWPALTAVFFTERLLDLLAAASLSLLAAAGDPRWYALSGVAAVFLGGIVLGFPLLFPRLARGTLRVRLDALGPLVHTGAQGLALFRWPPYLAGLALSVGAWGAEGLGLWLLLESWRPGFLSWQEAVGIYTVSLVTGALSFLPGGVGGTEAAMAVLLTGRGAPGPEAVSITLWCRLLTLWLAVALGWAAVAWLRLRLPALQRAGLPVPQTREAGCAGPSALLDFTRDEPFGTSSGQRSGRAARDKLRARSGQ
jgi:uncharacterized membrane protein YbhN (UPF0104 family)